MTTIVLVHHRVADYDAWQAAYDRVLAGPLAGDVRFSRVWRGLDDPNLVVVAETYPSREAAEAALGNPELPEVMAQAGVEMASMRIDYLYEVAAIEH
jgi:hypothetical protein